MTNKKLISSFLIITFILTISINANAADTAILNHMLDVYRSAANQWLSPLQKAAQWIFWTLVAISMVWTFAQLAVANADISGFFAELLKFTVFVGFFDWLLLHGASIALAILSSLQTLANQAGGTNFTGSPSDLVRIGFKIFDSYSPSWSVFHPGQVVAALPVIICIIGVIIILALVGINYLIKIIGFYMLAYAGVFVLGFGGGKWTSDLAINYFKAVLSAALEIFAYILVVSLGTNVLATYAAAVSQTTGEHILANVIGMLIATLVLYLLSNSIPAMIAGLINGNIGAHGGSHLGAAAGAAAAAVGGLAIAAKAATGAIKGGLGGGSAVKAAYDKAGENPVGGSISDGGGKGGGEAGSTGGGNPESLLSQAMGGDNGGSGQDGSSGQDGQGLKGDKGDKGDTGDQGQSGTDGENGTDSESGDNKEDSANSGSENSGSENSGSANNNSTVSEAGSNNGGNNGGLGSRLLHTAGILGGATASHIGGNIKSAVKNSIAETTGGQIAQKIKDPSAPTKAEKAQMAQNILSELQKSLDKK